MITVGKFIAAEWTKMPKKGSANGLFQNAKANNVNLFYFFRDDINQKTHTINGHFFDEHGDLYLKEIEYPDIIDNHSEICPIRYRQLYERSIITRPTFYPNKLEKYNLYTANTTDARLKNLMIPLSPCETFSDFENAIEKYGNNVVYKPNVGFRGKGVERLRKEDGLYYIKTNEKSITLDYDDWKTYYKENIAGKLYIMQSYFGSTTSSGAPFHIRVVAKKGRDGELFTSIYSRCGKFGELTSNGTHAEKVDVFLAREFPDTALQIKNDLDNIARDLPKIIDDLFDNNLSDMGIDMGIEHKDGTYKIGIFEVNTGGVEALDFLVDFNIKTTFDYYWHLYDTNKKKEHKQ